MNKPMNILLLGPRSNLKHGLLGGATVSFDQLVNFIESTQHNSRVINTQKYFGKLGKFLNAVFILTRFSKYLFWCDAVFLNASRGGIKFLAFPISTLAKWFGKQFFIRPFGGNLSEYSDNFSPWSKHLFRRALNNSDIFFLQTASLMDTYKYFGNTFQLKTSRPRPADELYNQKRLYRKRFVYLGAVMEEKGIDLIIQVASQLDSNYTIHIYGPIQEAKYELIFKKYPGLYQGAVDKSDILNKLDEYDVLLLPTHYSGEGYPGVIIEAYSLGMPVVSTYWKSIPEIVQDQKTGVLIEPRSSVALKQAISAFNGSNYLLYSKQAKKYFENNFESGKVYNAMLQKIVDLTRS